MRKLVCSMIFLIFLLVGCSDTLKSPVKYDVTYNANGATFGIAPVTQIKIEDIDMLIATNSGNLKRTGYTFAGWNTSLDGNGIDFAPGTSYQANNNLILYAKWIANEWQILTQEASFSPRDGAGEIVFNDKMWILGGYTPAQQNDIWSSNDGMNWILEKEHAEWFERNCFGIAIYNNKIYIIGGYELGGTILNDIWSSSNGIDWTREPDAGFTPRYAPALLAFGDKLYLIGGGEGTLGSNDVWPYDGISWEKEQDAPWTPRGRHASVIFKNKIWIMGGRSSQGEVLNDVWSYDGNIWRKEADAPWLPRMWFSANKYHSKIWIFGGSTINIDISDWYPMNDVWYSDDGLDWHELPHPAWEARHEYSCYIYDDGIYH